MKRTDVVALLALIVTIPAAAAWAGSLFAGKAKPCVIAGAAGYRFSDRAAANLTVRIAGAAADPSLRLQLVDDPNAADFVLLDDNDTADACAGASFIRSIRVDPAARAADLTVVLSRQPADDKIADYKIYVRSASFSETDAAALFAAMWTDSPMAGRGGKIAARD